MARGPRDAIGVSMVDALEKTGSPALTAATRISPPEVINDTVLETKGSVRFDNLWSRLFLKGSFEKQLGTPAPPPRPLMALLKFCERRFLKINLEEIPLRKPIFLIGLHRSGTTMLQDLLCAHPELGYITNAMSAFQDCFCAAEFYRKKLKLNVSGERFLGDGIKVESDSPNEGVPFWRDWLKEDLHSLEYQPKNINDFSEVEIENIHESIKKILWCFDGRPSRFFSKNPRVLPYLDLLKDLFPDGKFIHIVRDARPCANSMVKLYRLDQRQLEFIRSHGGHKLYPEGPYVTFPRLPGLAEYVKTYGADSLETTARIWNEAIDWVNEVKDRLPSFYEVRYEDVLARPGEEIRKILDFCELPEIPPQHRAFWEKFQQIGVVRHSNHYGGFDRVEEICGDNLKKYGYLKERPVARRTGSKD